MPEFKKFRGRYGEKQPIDVPKHKTFNNWNEDREGFFQ